MLVNGTHYRTVWLENSTVKMINQPLLPHSFEIYESKDYQQTAAAIKTMIIRGAGAIGTAGGYALVQAALEAPDKNFIEFIDTAYKNIASTRPTAQNLFYALNRVNAVLQQYANEPIKARAFAIREGEAIALEDIAACQRIGELGSALIKNNDKILTHCNAGWLAFTDWGSALSPIYHAKRQGKQISVWVDETRPRCQGAFLTAWELSSEGIPCALIADNAAGYYMYNKEVNLVITGSDRIAMNGDIANKIGTYEKAVLAKENNIPFYIAAPLATIDWNCQSGKDIPIEERSADEVTIIQGKDEKGQIVSVRLTSENVSARNPAFDITPAKYITGIITEKGIIKPDQLHILKSS